MFQHKIAEIFSDMPNVFDIMDDTSVIGYNDNGTDHDAAVHKVLQRCEEVNFEIEKRSTTHPQKIKVLTEMPVPNNKKELQAFLGTIIFIILLFILLFWQIFSRDS